MRESGAVPCRMRAPAFPSVSRSIPKFPKAWTVDLGCEQLMVPEGLFREVRQENEEERGR